MSSVAASRNRQIHCCKMSCPTFGERQDSRKVKPWATARVGGHDRVNRTDQGDRAQFKAELVECLSAEAFSWFL